MGIDILMPSTSHNRWINVVDSLDSFPNTVLTMLLSGLRYMSKSSFSLMMIALEEKESPHNMFGLFVVQVNASPKHLTSFR